MIAIIIAGGHGVAPLFALAKEALKGGSKAEFFTGAAASARVVCVKELKKMGSNVHVSTDDGSLGAKGLVTEAVRRFLEKKEAKKALREEKFAIYACGPAPMTEAVARISEEFGIPAEATRDSYMACGIGVCRGCAVETPDGVKLACKDGPVFDAFFAGWKERGVCE